MQRQGKKLCYMGAINTDSVRWSHTKNNIKKGKEGRKKPWSKQIGEGSVVSVSHLMYDGWMTSQSVLTFPGVAAITMLIIAPFCRGCSQWR